MKSIFVTIAFLLIAFCVQAQIPGFNIGPKIGYNTRKFSSKLEDFKSDQDGAFQIGGFARIGKKIYVQPEVNYVVKGGKISFNGNDNVMIKMKSITIPVLIGYKVINAGIFNLRLMAGPAVSMIINKDISGGPVISGSPSIAKDDLKDSMWSVQMGGGLDVLNFTLDLRYEIGVDNIYTGDAVQDFKLRNNLFNISLGFKLL
jgi:hypothetical protein